MKGKRFNKDGYIAQAIQGMIQMPGTSANILGANTSLKMKNLSGKIWWRIENGIFSENY